MIEAGEEAKFMSSKKTRRKNTPDTHYVFSTSVEHSPKSTMCPCYFQNACVGLNPRQNGAGGGIRRDRPERFWVEGVWDRPAGNIGSTPWSMTAQLTKSQHPRRVGFWDSYTCDQELLGPSLPLTPVVIPLGSVTGPC